MTSTAKAQQLGRPWLSMVETQNLASSVGHIWTFSTLASFFFKDHNEEMKGKTNKKYTHTYTHTLFLLPSKFS